MHPQKPGFILNFCVIVNTGWPSFPKQPNSRWSLGCCAWYSLESFWWQHDCIGLRWHHNQDLGNTRWWFDRKPDQTMSNPGTPPAKSRLCCVASHSSKHTAFSKSWQLDLHLEPGKGRTCSGNWLPSRYHIQYFLEHEWKQVCDHLQRQEDQDYRCP